MRVGIIGVSGYTGAELSRLLVRHPKVEISVVTSRQYAGQPVSDVFPHLKNLVDLQCENVDVSELVDKADLFFTAVPHKTAMDLVPDLLAAGKKVIDLSADFRIRDAKVYEQWYQPHSAVGLLSEAVYGLPELYREQVKSSRLIANPGCYPTSIILGLVPLLKKGLIDLSTIVIDSKSGTSGAGRSALVGSLYCEVADGFRAYKVGEHRHTPEIEQELAVLSGEDLTVSFTPHLLPVSRGILSTVYGKLKESVEQEQVQEIYDEFYGAETFVRICRQGSLPATQYVKGSNYCDIGFKVDKRTGRIVVISAIDNLVKGAAGQAIQNMNLVCGYEESAGLLGVPLFP
jgi:N-acetyl-gamma-glutamyl-phosphate reductase